MRINKFANTGIEMKESKDNTIDYRTQNNKRACVHGHMEWGYPDGGHVYKIDKSPKVQLELSPSQLFNILNAFVFSLIWEEN